jgi:hypothetical protein
MKKKDEKQKDWLKLHRMTRDLYWLTYGDNYKDYPELKEALKKIIIASDKLKKEIEGG